MKKWQQNLVDDIMDNFDFAKVEEVMNFLKWKWANEDGRLSIPDKGEIKAEARRLLAIAIKEKTWVEAGGFRAEYTPKYKDLSLRFVIAEWDAQE